MITAVNFRPKFYSPGYNPIIWSVTSDKAQLTTIFDFSYVFDVYIDGVYINRFIQRPNPSGAGMIDVAPIVEPFLEIGDFANEVGAEISKPFKMGSNAICNVKLYAGEQYRATSGAPLQVYDGLGNGGGNIGNPSYPLGAQGYFDDMDPTDDNDILPVIVIPTSLNWKEQQAHLAAQEANAADYYGLFGYVAPYVLKNNTIYPPSTCGGPGLFLSEAPRSIAGGARTSGQFVNRIGTAADIALVIVDHAVGKPERFGMLRQRVGSANEDRQCVPITRAYKTCICFVRNCADFTVFNCNSHY